jgi:hypothetical protein
MIEMYNPDDDVLHLHTESVETLKVTGDSEQGALEAAVLIERLTADVRERALDLCQHLAAVANNGS